MVRSRTKRRNLPCISFIVLAITRSSGEQKITDLNTKATSSITGVPINATNYAYQFVQKHLALQDAAASTSGGGQSYLLPLFTTSTSA
jgi:hypothetical protein